ncbi:hypothetical protein BT69DRAFT_1100730 [Atractiella rhizophila]|nr:hypothetical protein BT69DRAFT_1100730 [Atractiella rhizophila]
MRFSPSQTSNSKGDLTKLTISNLENFDNYHALLSSVHEQSCLEEELDMVKDEGFLGMFKRVGNWIHRNTTRISRRVGHLLRANEPRVDTIAISHPRSVAFRSPYESERSLAMQSVIDENLQQLLSLEEAQRRRRAQSAQELEELFAPSSSDGSTTPIVGFNEEMRRRSEANSISHDMNDLKKRLGTDPCTR